VGPRARARTGANRRSERRALESPRVPGLRDDPAISPEQSGYREVFATEAKTPNQAITKVRPLAEGRRFRAYLATGPFRDELADARWVA